MKEYNFLQKKAIEYPRVAGLIFILVGYYFLHTYIIESYNGILNQIPEVKISFWGIILGIIFPVFGLTFLLFGNKFAHVLFMDSSDLPKKQRILFYATLTIIIGALFFLVLKWFAFHGYTFF
jgi:hypothetical protein